MPADRRLLKAGAVVAAVAAAYAAGVGTGVLSAHHAATATAHGSVLDEAESRIAAQAAHPVTKDELERAAVQGMLSALDDRWSAYYGRRDYTAFQAVLSGHYTGVGLWVRRAGSELVVDSVQTGSPAASAGLVKGDVVVRVAGRAVGARSVADVVAKLRGDAGSAVTVVVRRDGRLITAALRRTSLNSDDVTATRLPDGVVRLRVAAFTRGVGRWVRAQVTAAQQRHASGIELDLRDNPGGLLDEAVETASSFLSGGTVVSYARRGAPRQVLDALGSGDTGTPLVVLVDGGTASAAEVVAAALQDRGRAVIVGSRTFGKGSVQEPSQLSDGSALELTVGRYYTPSGRSIDGTGLVPDVDLRPGTLPAVADRRASEVLSGLLADTGTSGRG